MTVDFINTVMLYSWLVVIASREGIPKDEILSITPTCRGDGVMLELQDMAVRLQSLIALKMGLDLDVLLEFQRSAMKYALEVLDETQDIPSAARSLTDRLFGTDKDMKVN